jgi:pimeloyl-ACP methyl ester carboxylesterase
MSAGALLAAVLSLAASPAQSSASSALSFVPCPRATGLGCSTLPVPLDRSGALSGTISLSVERRLAAAAPASEAVVALAGGPGQATLPLGEFVSKAIAPALATRDLLLFDQRGTGASDPLSCSAFEAPGALSEGALFERCALDLGPARGSFTSEETVEDIEALRRAAGYERLVLYGTSYGTKVALQYAERYPTHVSALVLDSVVPGEGEEPFYLASYRAIGPVLSELCSAGACAGITSNPLADLARLAARLSTHVLRGRVYDGRGHRHATSLGEVGLYKLLVAGDLNPALRALLPAAVRSALHNDPDPLLRLRLLSEGLIPNLPNAQPAASGDEIDEALFATTICEETPFPWRRDAAPAAREVEALAFLHAQPPAAFFPFDAATVLEASLVPGCSHWPDASPPPPPARPLPDVPTLILSGSQDLRTPTELARGVAAQIPDAQLEVVPFTGHSVLGSDLSGCGERALAAFFAGNPVQPCGTVANQFSPTPVTPTSLAAVHPPGALPGRPGRTLVAVLDTLLDLDRQVIGATIQADAELPSGASFGGLRGGYARLTSTALTLHRFSFVPGVQLSGSFPVRHGRLQAATVRIGGPAAAAGSVRLGGGLQRAVGTLGGRRFNVSLARVRLSRATAAGWPPAGAIRRLLSRVEGAARGAGPVGRSAPRLP